MLPHVKSCPFLCTTAPGCLRGGDLGSSCGEEQLKMLPVKANPLPAAAGRNTKVKAAPGASEKRCRQLRELETGINSQQRLGKRGNGRERGTSPAVPVHWHQWGSRCFLRDWDPSIFPHQPSKPDPSCRGAEGFSFAFDANTEGFIPSLCALPTPLFAEGSCYRNPAIPAHCPISHCRTAEEPLCSQAPWDGDHDPGAAMDQDAELRGQGSSRACTRSSMNGPPRRASTKHRSRAPSPWIGGLQEAANG